MSHSLEEPSLLPVTDQPSLGCGFLINDRGGGPYVPVSKTFSSSVFKGIVVYASPCYGEI